MKRLLMLLVFLSCVATGCSKRPVATYKYINNEDIPAVSVLKTEVYDDKLMVYFSEDALPKAEEVKSYADDFSVLKKQEEFHAEDDVLTIYSTDAKKISGLKVTINNEKYYDIRYLNSEEYAMLLYTWADDYGMMPNGDEDAYYTEEEKQEKKRRQEEALKAKEEAFSLITGVWEDEEETVRIEIKKDGEQMWTEVYHKDGSEWTFVEGISAYSVWSEEDGQFIKVYIEEARGYSMLYEFILNNDRTEMECSLTEKKLIRVD